MPDLRKSGHHTRCQRIQRHVLYGIIFQPLRAGQIQQLAQNVPAAQRFGCQLVQRLVAHGFLFMLTGDTSLQGNRGQWRTQLMRHVRRELPLPAGLGLQAVNQAVDRLYRT